MKLNEIHDEWDKDSHIDKIHLSEELIKISKLHAKYIRYLTEEQDLLRRKNIQRNKLKIELDDYYRKDAPLEWLKEKKRDVSPKMVIDSQRPLYIDTDNDMIKLDLSIGISRDKILLVESILQSLHSRGYAIRDMIAIEKFKAGEY